MPIYIFCLLTFICGSCSNSKGPAEPNDPYVIENTEFNYEPPAPYYDEKDQ